MLDNDKIILLIDNLTSGGAQRQIVMLAKLLKQIEFNVEVVAYHDSDFFEDELVEFDIPITRFSGMGHLLRAIRIRRYLRNSSPKAVIAFLSSPSIIAELSTLPTRKFRLIVGERTGKVASPRLIDRVRFQTHRLADVVVSNSNHLRDYIVRYAPWLADKTKVIINCVDLDYFHRESVEFPSLTRFLVVARFHYLKNPINVVRAVKILVSSGFSDFELNWYGNAFIERKKHSASFFETVQMRKELGLERHIKFHKPRTDVRPLYHSHSALILASNHEGFSNVLGEGAASSLPLLASNVCDNPVLVKDGSNGFLFDAKSPESIADAMKKFLKTDNATRIEMGQTSRAIAEELLSPENFVRQYKNLIGESASRTC